MSWPSEGLSGDLTPALGFDHKWKNLMLALIFVPLLHSHVTKVGGAGCLTSSSSTVEVTFLLIPSHL